MNEADFDDLMCFFYGEFDYSEKLEKSADSTNKEFFDVYSSFFYKNTLL